MYWELKLESLAAGNCFLRITQRWFCTLQMFISISYFSFSYLYRFSNVLKVVTENAFICSLVFRPTNFISRKSFCSLWKSFYMERDFQNCFHIMLIFPEIWFLIENFRLFFFLSLTTWFRFRNSLLSLHFPSHPHLIFLGYILHSWILLNEKPYGDLPTFTFHVFLLEC